MTSRHESMLLSERQRGAALVVSLIILIMVAILGISGMRVASTLVKQAGNVQFQNAAFNQAETAVASISSWLYTGTNFRNAGFTTYAAGTPHIYPTGYMTTNGIDPLTMTWTDTNSLAVDAAGTQRVVVEKVAAGKVLAGSSLGVGGLASSGCKQVDLFRVTGRGTNARGTVKLVQTYNSVLSC